MKSSTGFHQILGRKKHLASCLAMAFALGAGSVWATGLEHVPMSTAVTRVVSNCNDSGVGSLRAVISQANDYDIIDMSGLDSCTIQLVSSIVTSVNNLTLQGKGNSKYVHTRLDGQDNLLPLHHKGTGTLKLKDMQIQHGKRKFAGPSVRGGCLYSLGNIELIDTTVKYCEAHNTGNGGNADGGGTASLGNTTLTHSVVSMSTATVGLNGSVSGGGIWSAGTVRIEDASIVSNSKAMVPGTGEARGGGIFSLGDFRVEYSIITYNTASTNINAAFGGGIFASSNARIKYSDVRNNVVSSTSMLAIGGGIDTIGDLKAKYATIADNQAASDSFDGYAGGINARANVEIDRTTISGNSAQHTGGLAMTGSFATKTLIIKNSTISGNTSTGSTRGAGVYTGHATKISNSTIAYNMANNPSAGTYGAGLSITGNTNVKLVSTIVSGNRLKIGSNTPVPSDIGKREFSGSTAPTLTGDHNFIGSTHDGIIRPPDSIGGTIKPALEALADNGGLTKTHALKPYSSAIDVGSATDQTHDQRGAGFMRTAGAQADIGAFEFGGDVIFVNGFD